jgi:hypothetical protein
MKKYGKIIVDKISSLTLSKPKNLLKPYFTKV